MDPHIRAQELIRCDLCKTELVQVHCDTCHIKLCNACIGEHMASDETKKKHEIVRFIYRKSIPLYPRCTSHDKEQCEMYCNQCYVPVCITCIASEQHSGQKILKILQILDEKKEKIIKEQNELNDTIFLTYKDISTDVQNSLKQLEKEYGDLSKAIAKHGDDWHREIDQVVKKLTVEVDKMKTEQIQTLQKHLDDINEKISEIRDEINSAAGLLVSHDISKLFSFTLNIDKYVKLPQKIVLSLPKFIPGTVQGKELFNLFGNISSWKLTSEEHGYSIKTTQKSSEAGSSPPVKQLLKESQIVSTIHTGHKKYHYNVACLSDEEIWASGFENTMNLFSINDGSLLETTTTKSGNIPYDIAVTKHGNLLYTDPNDKTINIVKNEKVENVIKLQNWKPRNACSTSSGDLLVVLENDDIKQSKVRYSGSTEKQTIQFDDKDKPLYSSYDTKYISENKNLDICVADCAATAIVVVNQGGKLRFRYTGHPLTQKRQPFKPRGITTDSQSHILTADIEHSSINIIDRDGQFLAFIDCGLSLPWGLCIDTNDNLLVAQWGNEQVMKIKYMQ